MRTKLVINGSYNKNNALSTNQLGVTQETKDQINCTEENPTRSPEFSSTQEWAWERGKEIWEELGIGICNLMIVPGEYLSAKGATGRTNAESSSLSMTALSLNLMDNFQFSSYLTSVPALNCSLLEALSFLVTILASSFPSPHFILYLTFHCY